MNITVHVADAHLLILGVVFALLAFWVGRRQGAANAFQYLQDNNLLDGDQKDAVLQSYRRGDPL